MRYLLNEKIDSKEICVIDSVTNKKYISKDIDFKLDEELYSDDFFEWVLMYYPKLILRISKKYLNDSYCLKCYNKVDSDTKKELINNGYMVNLIKTEMLKELEICKIAVSQDRYNIRLVPFEFQTFEVQKIAIDTYGYKIISSIPKKCLLEETIKYALNKNGNAIAGVPKEKRTFEYCNIAFNNNIKSIKYFPDSFKTYNMCLKAVISYPYLIKYVPNNIINENFIKELNNLGVIIPDKYCILINSQNEDKTNDIVNEIEGNVDESITYLQDELNILLEERKLLDEKIKIIEKQIQERNQNNSLKLVYRES